MAVQTFAGCRCCPDQSGSGSGSGGSGSGDGPDDRVPTACCPLVERALYLTLGGSLAALGTVPLTFNGTLWTTAQLDTCHNSAMRATWSCTGSNWLLAWVEEGTSYPPGVGGILATTTTAMCEPFYATGSGTNVSNACNGGPAPSAYTFTVSETPP